MFQKESIFLILNLKNLFQLILQIFQSLKWLDRIKHLKLFLSLRSQRQLQKSSKFYASVLMLHPEMVKQKKQKLHEKHNTLGI